MSNISKPVRFSVKTQTEHEEYTKELVAKVLGKVAAASETNRLEGLAIAWTELDEPKSNEGRVLSAASAKAGCVHDMVLTLLRIAYTMHGPDPRAFADMCATAIADQLAEGAAVPPPSATH